VWFLWPFVETVAFVESSKRAWCFGCGEKLMTNDALAPEVMSTKLWDDQQGCYGCGLEDGIATSVQ
jgi:hypothetical protein